MSFDLKIVDANGPGNTSKTCLIEITPTGNEARPHTLILRFPSGIAHPRLMLEQDGVPRELIPADEAIALDSAQSRSLQAALKIGPEIMAELSILDRRILGLLLVCGDKPMTAGRLTYILSDLFDGFPLIQVRNRLTAIKAVFESHGQPGLLPGDQETGFRVGV